MRVLMRARDGRKLPQSEFQSVCSHMVLLAHQHEGALRACQDEIRNLLAHMYPKQALELASRILSFVGERAAQQWLQDRLGVI